MCMRACNTELRKQVLPVLCSPGGGNMTLVQECERASFGKSIFFGSAKVAPVARLSGLSILEEEADRSIVVDLVML